MPEATPTSVTVRFTNLPAAIDWFRYARRDGHVPFESGLRAVHATPNPEPVDHLLVTSRPSPSSGWTDPPLTPSDQHWVSQTHAGISELGPVLINQAFADLGAAIDWFAAARRKDYLPVRSGLRRPASDLEVTGVTVLAVNADSRLTGWLVPPPQPPTRARISRHSAELLARHELQVRGGLRATADNTAASDDRAA
jgi:hypothetical protein